MELSGWKDCRWHENHVLALIPPAWEAFQTFYGEVVSFVSKFPFRKRLVVYFVIRGTQIKVDFGDVKAAGIVCALGVGFGLSTLLVYRLYSNYIRPAISKDPPPPEKFDTSIEDDDCYFYMGSSESSAGIKMGNSSSSEDNEPSVHYSAQYGVAFGTDYRKKKETVTEGVRLRPKRRNRQPSVQSDKDSAIGVASELGQSFYSDAAYNRDSFYSTCTTESGFENMQESYDESTCEGWSQNRQPSLKGTYSPRTPYSKYIHEHTDIPELSTPSSHSVNSKDSVLAHTIPEEISPSHSNSLPQTVIETESPPTSPPNNANWENMYNKNTLLSDYDPSLDQSESLSRFSGCASVDSSSWDSEDKPSPVHNQQGQNEQQFRQSLMNRLKEWSNRSFDFVSRSPTPDIDLPEGLMRRSRSLDRQISLLTPSDCALFENETLGGKTTENLEHIEDELHGIQDEFEEITSQINALINRSSSHEGVGEVDEPITFRAKSPTTEPNSSLADKVRQHFEKSSGLPIATDSVNNSRASSVELSWDLDVEDDIFKPRHRRLLTSANNSGENSEPSSGEHSEKNSPFRRARHSPRRIMFSVDLTSAKSFENCEVFLDSISENAELPSKTIVHKRKNIGEALDLEEYSESQWKGDTDKARNIKQGYKKMKQLMNCNHIRKIRGDNYCAIRACLYQMLTTTKFRIDQWPSMMNIIDQLKELYEDPTTGLAEWTFANRLTADVDKLSMISKCVLTLYSTVEIVNKSQNYEEKVKVTLNLLNSHPDTDLELMEGIKLLMLVKAVKLFKDNEKGKDIPVFASLMFARDTSDSVCKFVSNHLCPVGDTGGLEQVEMCLLGQTIGTVIKVARLAQFGEDDFLCKFPEDSPRDWSTINLIAEDDRHYNVPTL